MKMSKKYIYFFVIGLIKFIIILLEENEDEETENLLYFVFIYIKNAHKNFYSTNLHSKYIHTSSSNKTALAFCFYFPPFENSHLFLSIPLIFCCFENPMKNACFVPQHFSISAQSASFVEIDLFLFCLHLLQ